MPDIHAGFGKQCFLQAGAGRGPGLSCVSLTSCRSSSACPAFCDETARGWRARLTFNTWWNALLSRLISGRLRLRPATLA